MGQMQKKAAELSKSVVKLGRKRSVLGATIGVLICLYLTREMVPNDQIEQIIESWGGYAIAVLYAVKSMFQK